jgi:phosphatidylethanolamine-binding protein (PEBP) family uncharacterized protein
MVSHSLDAFSSTFTNGGLYPKKYTCDSLGISPTISWKNAPLGTNGYAIAMYHYPNPSDLSVKHVYLVLYNIPSTTNKIEEAQQSIGNFGINTVNSKNEYTPPCSQGPGPKQYIITVYALSKQPIISVAPSSITMDVMLNAISNTILDTSSIFVTYSRP